MKRAGRGRSAQLGTFDAAAMAGPPGRAWRTPARAARPHPAHSGGEASAGAGPAAGSTSEVPSGAGPATPQRPSGAGLSGLRAAAAKPFARQLLVLACYLAGGIAATWVPGPHPRVTYLGTLVPGSRDSASYVWDLWWVARQLSHLGNPWFTGYMAAPVGVQIGFHTLMPLPGVLLAPITLGLSPVWSYNLLVAAVPGLLGYAMYRAARLWLRSGTAAVAAGAFFGYSAMLTQQDLVHVNIAAGAIFLPLALEASVRLRRRPGRRQALILGLVIGAAVLTDQESAVLAAIVAALTLLPWLLREHSWSTIWPVGLAALSGAVIASPQIVAMAQEAFSGALTGTPGISHLMAVSYTHYGIGLPGMFSPTPRVGDVGLGVLAKPFLHSRDNENLPMFGTVLTVLALGGVAAARRKRGTWPLAALWVGSALLALGPSLWIGMHEYLPLASTWNGVQVSDVMPYTWFVRIPGLSSFREADRLAILGLLPAALLAGAAIDWLRYRSRTALVVVLALSAIELGWPPPAALGSHTVQVIPTASYRAVDRGIAADHSHSIVLDIPFGLRGGIPENGVPFFPQALYMATLDGHPRSIAYVSRLPQSTIKAIDAHPFYNLMIFIQHESAPACPWRAPRQPDSTRLCLTPPGVALIGIGLNPSQVAAARRDASRMGIGWAVVWKRNPSEATFVRPYLLQTGFTFDYRVGKFLVYRHHS